MNRLAARVCSLVAAALALALPALAGAQRHGGDDPRPEVRSLVIEGTRAAREEDLRRSIVTTASSCRSPLLAFTFCPFFKNPTFFDRYYLDREELQRDVLRIRVFYWQRGFREAAVDTAVTRLGDDAVRVHFRITEGPPTVVQSVRVVGVDGIIAPDSVDRLVVLDSGEALSYPALDSSVANLRAALWQEGYADAVVDTAVAVNRERRVGAVLIRAQPRWIARVDTVLIDGLQQLDTSTVRNSLYLREGSIYRRTALERSQRSLYESNLFQRAVLDVSGDSLKTVMVSVTEADLHNARVRGGFNTANFVQFDALYVDHNFSGHARRLDVSAAIGNLGARRLSEFGWPFRDVAADVVGDADPFFRPTWQASLRVQQPWFRSRRNTLAASVFAHRRSEPGVVIDRGYGANATFTRRLALRMPLSFTYQYEVTRVEAGEIYYCVNFGVCDQQTIEIVSGSQRLSPLAVVWSVTRTDDPVAPVRGWTAQASVERASKWTLSDFEYLRGTLEGTAYRPLGPGLVLAGRVRLGYTAATGGSIGTDLLGGKILHPRSRFYAGGSRSVRGFYESQLGPRVLTIDPALLEERGCAPPFADCAVLGLQEPLVVNGDTIRPLDDGDFEPRPVGGRSLVEASVELRAHLWGPLTGAVFLDGAGLTAGRSGAFSSNFGALTPGFGVRYASPVGPIRVDIGLAPTLFNPGYSEELPVFSEAEVDGTRRLVRVGSDFLDSPDRDVRRLAQRGYAPGRAKSGWERFFNNVVLHLSIGEAY